jgi:glycerate kinase
MAYKVFTNGFTLNASELNTYLMNQSVMVFADASARSTALTSPTEGMVTYLESTNALEFYDGTVWGAVGADTVLTNVLITAPRETTRIEADATSGTEQLSVLTGSHLYHTSNATGNFTLNVRGSGATTLNSLLSVGETSTVVFSVTNGATPYVLTALTIDGNAQTVRWQGGTAPASGNANSIDVYTFAITKTAATPTYMVLGSQTRFA